MVSHAPLRPTALFIAPALRARRRRNHRGEPRECGRCGLSVMARDPRPDPGSVIDRSHARASVARSVVRDAGRGGSRPRQLRQPRQPQQPQQLQAREEGPGRRSWKDHVGAAPQARAPCALIFLANAVVFSKRAFKAGEHKISGCHDAAGPVAPQALRVHASRSSARRAVPSGRSRGPHGLRPGPRSCMKRARGAVLNAVPARDRSGDPPPGLGRHGGDGFCQILAAHEILCEASHTAQGSGSRGGSHDGFPSRGAVP